MCVRLRALYTPFCYCNLATVKSPLQRANGGTYCSPFSTLAEQTAVQNGAINVCVGGGGVYCFTLLSPRFDALILYKFTVEF